VAEKNEDQLSRLDKYQQRLDQLMESARQGFERQSPEVLDKLAVTARNIAGRLDDMADDARQRRAEKAAAPNATSASEGVAEPSDQPPAASSTS
jgi:hypothetical protein